MSKKPLWKLFKIGAFISLVILCYIAAVYFDEGPLRIRREVNLPFGSSLSKLTSILNDNKVIEHPLIFKLIARMRGETQFRAGYYDFMPHISMQSVMDQLLRGDVKMVNVTIPEGLTTHQIVNLLEANPDLDGPVGPVPPEGWLLPETYNVPKGTHRQTIVRMMKEAMAQFLLQAWRGRDLGLPLKSPDEALNLAAIVERETSVPEERALVASVYINRLKQDMILQADPTLIYGMSQGRGTLPRLLVFKDLRQDHAFNTYTRKGLPPSPIANPGKASILAALHPAKTNALYFVADGKGGHHFSTTLADHNKRVLARRKEAKLLKSA